MTDVIENTQDDEVQTQTLEQLFDAEPDEGEEQVETEEETEEESEDTTEEETEENAETTAAKEESVPVKALTEERRKRQEAEEKLKALQGKLKPDDDAPDPIDDPKGYAKYVEDKGTATALKLKVGLSRDMMLDIKEDYAEKEAVFIELAQKRPHLIQEMRDSPNPAKYAYQTASEHLEIEKFRDPKYKETLKEELRQELLAEIQGKPNKTGKKTALDVPNLTKATAAGKNTSPVEKEETLDDMMADSAL